MKRERAGRGALSAPKLYLEATRRADHAVHRDAQLAAYLALPPDATYDDADLDKAFRAASHSRARRRRRRASSRVAIALTTGMTPEGAVARAYAALYTERAAPALLLPREAGNSYCASIFGALLSLLTTVGSAALVRARRPGAGGVLWRPCVLTLRRPTT